jgi:hypothetical protein
MIVTAAAAIITSFAVAGPLPSFSRRPAVLPADNVVQQTTDRLTFADVVITMGGMSGQDFRLTRSMLH